MDDSRILRELNQERARYADKAAEVSRLLDEISRLRRERVALRARLAACPWPEGLPLPDELDRAYWISGPSLENGPDGYRLVERREKAGLYLDIPAALVAVRDRLREDSTDE